jgi:hypothetical protein
MELLIQIVDHGPNLDNIKSGEVITIQPDGWGWTANELNNPNWRIVRAPILPTHAATLMRHHTSPDVTVRGQKYRRKAYLLDLALLPALNQGITPVNAGLIVAASKRQ